MGVCRTESDARVVFVGERTSFRLRLAIETLELDQKSATEVRFATRLNPSTCAGCL